MSVSQPNLNVSDIQTSGIYFRNLKKDDVARVFTEFEAGLRLRRGVIKKWEWRENGKLALSVNWKECCHSPEGSLQLSSDCRFTHVWEIDLEKLNAYIKGYDVIAAKYDPVITTSVNNPCHFVLIASEGKLTENQIILIIANLEDAIPPEEKTPKTSPPRDRVDEALDRVSAYHEIVKIHTIQKR